MYAITAQVVHKTEDGWGGSRSIPTFYLHPNVQGILNEDHARRIALDILTATNPTLDRAGLHIAVVNVGDETWLDNNSSCPDCKRSWQRDEFGNWELTHDHGCLVLLGTD